MLHRGSASDGKAGPGVEDMSGAPVWSRDAESCEAGAQVLLGVDTWVGTGRGTSIWLGPTPVGAYWERGATCTRRVNSVPRSWAPSLTLSYSLILQVLPVSHPIAFFPCSVKDVLMGLQGPSWPQGGAASRFTVIRSPVLGGVHQVCPVETHDQEAQK